jgi:chromosome segregation ATPase
MRPCCRSSRNSPVNPRTFLFFVLALCCVAPLSAQRQHRQPLSEAQIEQIREAGIDPDQRIRLYVRFVAEHVDAVGSLAKRGASSARTQRLDDALQDLTELMDELGSNLDQYGGRKADLRKSLKALNESASHWLESLRALPHEPGFDISRKEALESAQDLADQATQLEKEQNTYFATHKDEGGQDRSEPK